MVSQRDLAGADAADPGTHRVLLFLRGPGRRFGFGRGLNPSHVFASAIEATMTEYAPSANPTRD